VIRQTIATVLGSPPAQDLALAALRTLDAETAHRATLMALRVGTLGATRAADPPELATTIAGVALTNPVGVAAGFDKNAEVPEVLAQLGFGLVEVGTVTPRRQTGNPRPRLFRLHGAGAVINRMGFNNDGHDAAHRRLAGPRRGCVLGVNIGANKDSEDFVADYVLGVRRFASIADYLTINISSPNTPRLRSLQAAEALTRLLGAVLEARAAQARRAPVFLKLAPDLNEQQMDEIAAVIGRTDLDGLIVSNTTIDHSAVSGLKHGGETGGLSGKPLFPLATQRLAQIRQRVGDLPIIGVGGIHSAETAVAKFEAGADAIQLYTALVYRGLPLLREIKEGLVAAVRARGATNVSALTGTHVEDWAAGKVN
jgi:dihydroorotate dehydrogenase